VIYLLVDKVTLISYEHNYTKSSSTFFALFLYGKLVVLVFDAPQEGQGQEVPST